MNSYVVTLAIAKAYSVNDIFIPSVVKTSVRYLSINDFLVTISMTIIFDPFSRF